MKNDVFVIERTYNAPIEKVWKALTDRDQMKQWYFDLKEFRPEVGFEFRFTGGKEGRTYLHICKITEVIPGKKLRHTWTYDGLPGVTFVTFELFREGEQTRLKLSHEGLENLAGHGPDFARTNFEEGWTYIIGTSLRNFLEKTK
jgi:uncharacterized protein YndB with AHSA1/START domain